MYGTAFAVAGVTPCLFDPEPEVFLGEIGFASYQTPAPEMPRKSVVWPRKTKPF